MWVKETSAGAPAAPSLLPRSSFHAKGQGDNPECSGQVEETGQSRSAKLEPTGQSPGEEEGAAQSKLLTSAEASLTL